MLLGRLRGDAGTAGDRLLHESRQDLRRGDRVLWGVHHLYGRGLLRRRGSVMLAADGLLLGRDLPQSGKRVLPPRGRSVALAEYHLKVVPSVNGGFQGSNDTNQQYDVLFRRKFLATGTQVDVTGGTHVFATVPQVAVPHFTETRVTVSQPVLQG